MGSSLGSGLGASGSTLGGGGGLKLGQQGTTGLGLGTSSLGGGSLGLSGGGGSLGLGGGGGWGLGGGGGLGLGGGGLTLGQQQQQQGGLNLGLGQSLGVPTSGLGLGGTTSLGQRGMLGGVGLGLGGGSGLQQPQQQPQQNLSLALMVQALSQPVLFGDDRDKVLAKFNQLQAYWGFGKGIANSQQTVDFASDNPFCRFKAIAYNRLFESKDEDGIIGIRFRQREGDLKEKKTQIEQTFHRILGGKQELSVHVESIRGLPNDHTEVVLYIAEQSFGGGSRRIPASKVYTFLQSTSSKSQLQQNGAEEIYLKTGMTSTQVKAYLGNPPSSVDDFAWDRAKEENPDPTRLVPVPLVGLSEVRERMKQQEQETSQHQSRLKILQTTIREAQQQHAVTMSKLAQLKRKHVELARRIVSVMVHQEIVRKQGFAIQPEEEQLRIQFDSLQSELNAPLQFKGRLSELMSQIRLQSQARLTQNDGEFHLDPAHLENIQQHLKEQQRGLKHLKEIIEEDFEDLRIIEEGLA